MLPYLSSSQLLDWQRYAAQFGLGINRDDIHWGLLLSLLFNVHKQEGEPAAPPSQFMPYYDPYADDLSIEEMRARIGVRTPT